MDNTNGTPAIDATPITTINSPEELNAAFERVIASTDFSKFPADTLKEHKPKEGEEHGEGMFLSVRGRLSGTQRLAYGDGNLYSKNVNFQISAFKVQDSPYAVSGKVSADRPAPLTFDQVQAKLKAAKVAAAK